MINPKLHHHFIAFDDDKTTMTDRGLEDHDNIKGIHISHMMLYNQLVHTLVELWTRDPI